MAARLLTRLFRNSRPGHCAGTLLYQRKESKISDDGEFPSLLLDPYSSRNQDYKFPGPAVWTGED